MLLRRLRPAAEQIPSVGVALTVPFFTTSQLVTTHRPAEGTDVPQPVRDFVAEVDRETARRLFDLDRLAPLLADTEPPAGLDRQMRVQYEAARVMAREELDAAEPTEGESDENPPAEEHC